MFSSSKKILGKYFLGKNSQFVKVDLFSPLAGQIHPITCHQLERSDRGGYPEPIGLDHFFCHIMHLSHVIPEDHVVPKNNVFWIIFHALSSYGSSPPLGLGTGFSGGFLTLDSIHRFSRYASFSHDYWAISSHESDTLILLLALTYASLSHDS